MSRRDQFKTNTNPSEVNIEWAGDRDDGFFYYYNKDESRKIQLNALRFVALGERVGITGYSQDMKTGLYSNEVQSTDNQILTVKYFKDGKSHELLQGKYKDIKEQARAKGGKFTAFVYAMILDCDEIQTGTIVKILMSGACTSPWIQLKKDGKAEDAVKVVGYSDEANGGIKFRAPKFEADTLDETEDSESEEAYKKVVEYFKGAPSTVESHEASPSASYTDADAPADPELPTIEEDEPPF
jgi:hypothetical protein